MNKVLCRCAGAVQGVVTLFTGSEGEDLSDSEDGSSAPSPRLLLFGASPKKARGRTAPPAFSEANARSEEWLRQVAQYFLDGGTLPAADLTAIVEAAHALWAEEPAMVEISVPPGAFVTILGDTHGQFDDVFTVLEVAGYPSDEHVLIFNGDIVDRGPKQLQLITLVLLLKIAYPRRVFVVRGNHEMRCMNEVTDRGFKGVVSRKYGVAMWHAISNMFDDLPVTALVQGVLMCVHGGLPAKAAEQAGLALADFRRLSKGDLDGWVHELLWNDSSPMRGVRDNQRGPGTFTFGADVTRKFMEQNSLRAVVRAHDVRMAGYTIEHGRRLVTVFSAPNYCNLGNTAAFLHVGAEELTEHFCVRAAHFLAFPARKDLTPDAVQALQARLLAKRRAVERAVERAAGLSDEATPAKRGGDLDSPGSASPKKRASPANSDSPGSASPKKRASPAKARERAADPFTTPRKKRRVADDGE